VKIKLTLRPKRAPRKIIPLRDIHWKERGSIPGSQYTPKNSNPLRKMRNRSDTSTQGSDTSSSGAKKGRGRPKGAAAKETKEPAKGERSSARQAGKKADGDGEVKATRGKKRKSEDDHEPVTTKKGKMGN
jgi:hypothetical protein